MALDGGPHYSFSIFSKLELLKFSTILDSSRSDSDEIAQQIFNLLTPEQIARFNLFAMMRKSLPNSPRGQIEQNRKPDDLEHFHEFINKAIIRQHPSVNTGPTLSQLLEATTTVNDSLKVQKLRHR